MIYIPRYTHTRTLRSTIVRNYPFLFLGIKQAICAKNVIPCFLSLSLSIPYTNPPLKVLSSFYSPTHTHTHTKCQVRKGGLNRPRAGHMYGADKKKKRKKEEDTDQ